MLEFLFRAGDNHSSFASQPNVLLGYSFISFFSPLSLFPSSTPAAFFQACPLQLCSFWANGGHGVRFLLAVQLVFSVIASGLQTSVIRCYTQVGLFFIATLVVVCSFLPRNACSKNKHRHKQTKHVVRWLASVPHIFQCRAY